MRNHVEPVVQDPIIGPGGPNLHIRRRNRQVSDGVNISKSFIIKISVAIALVHMVIISLMGYAYLEDWIEI